MNCLHGRLSRQSLRHGSPNLHIWTRENPRSDFHHPPECLVPGIISVLHRPPFPRQYRYDPLERTLLSTQTSSQTYFKGLLKTRTTFLHPQLDGTVQSYLGRISLEGGSRTSEKLGIFHYFCWLINQLFMTLSCDILFGSSSEEPKWPQITSMT